MFVANFLFISKPSIEKYFENGIVIEVSITSMDDLPSPAFTMMRVGPDG